MNKIVIMKTQLEIKRKELGMRTLELAQKMEMDASLMSRILNGKREASDKQLMELAEILSLSYEDLIKEKMARKINSILSEYPQLSEQVMLTVQEERVAYLSGENKFRIINIQSIQKELNDLSKMQKQWISQKPLNQLQLEKMAEYFHTQYTYESNQIEGNTLDFQETHLVVNEGITIGGKSIREHLEAINHQEAIDFIIDLATRKVDFNESILKQIHQIILKSINKENAGVYRSVPVRISGSKHIPPEPYLLEGLMYDYFRFYRFQKDKLHPVLLAAEMHERLVTIHPFIDGNGRTSRLVMNLILMQNGYPIVSLKGDLTNRQRYYKALEAVQVDHENKDFYELIMESTRFSLDEHLKLTN